MYNGFVVLDTMRNNKSYDGTIRKFGIAVDGVDYIVKMQKRGVSDVFSEHIASRFIQCMGVSVQETWLGYYNNSIVVIIKDFINKGEQLKSYSSTKQSSEITDIVTKEYTYKDVLHMINSHTKMSDKNKKLAVSQFWDMYLCDAILGNRDRHGGNWGYITRPTGYIPAPVYDNGGSLFPDLYKVIDKFNSSNEFNFLEERMEKFPASLFRIRYDSNTIKRTNYYEVLGDLRRNKEMARKVKVLREKISVNYIAKSIYSICYGVRFIVPYRYLYFYCMIVVCRYLHIICRLSTEKSYNTAKKLLRGYF